MVAWCGFSPTSTAIAHTPRSLFARLTLITPLFVVIYTLHENAAFCPNYQGITPQHAFRTWARCWP
jgi:hypothetical protein